MGQWSDDVKYGMTMEQKVCDELNARIPHWKVESWGGKDMPDFKWHGDLDQWKKMKFLHVNKSSTLRDSTHNEDTDPQRWDCSHIHEKINPYITSIRKDWTSIEKK